MRLFDKFESRSSKAKTVAFHPTRPWLLAGLFSSTIQLWDYRMGCIIDRFEGHQGPVRGLDIHPTQQIFVSCGDDQLVRVWSLNERRLMFTLEGHHDYVRTVFFHKELPWIVSASDDQTIRIWDWQSRKEIALLTGHNHWVSCAVFHPNEDLIISSSLDCTIRAWDITGLKMRYSAAGVLSNGQPGMGGFGNANVAPGGLPPWMSQNQSGLPPHLQPNSQGFGNDLDAYGSEVTTKFILEGHDRGITWVACHPTQPLIVSASDDRTLKVWRMSESRAWEIDTCRGHRDEVTSCVFNTHTDTIISCGTDETVRVWDLNKRTCISTKQYGTKDLSDRLWCLVRHPTQNLIGLARDNGLQVFKLKPEQPAFITSPVLACATAKDNQLKDLQGKVLASMNLTYQDRPMRLKRISYNAAENIFLTFHWKDASVNKDSAFISLYKNGSSSSPIKQREITGATDAVFISRNRIAVLAKSSQFLIYDLDLEQTKELSLKYEGTQIFEGMQQGHVYIISPEEIFIFDWQQNKVKNRHECKNIKRFAASTDSQMFGYGGAHPSAKSENRYVAFAGSHNVKIARHDLVPLCKIPETIKTKSICWHSNLPVLFYTTSSHLKYALSNGDSGILKSLKEPCYIVRVDQTEVVLATRCGTMETITIDPTEYRFKLALVNRNFTEVARLIETSQLVGQSIIAYLQKSGFPEIALEFVQDPKTRFDLAVEFGNLEVAAQSASQLQSPEFDERLAAAALEQGNHDLLEDVYQRQRNLDKLAFIYLITGNRSRLQRLEQISMQCGDASTRFQTSLFLHSIENRIELLQQAGLAPLAYALAKSNGLTDEAEQILAENEIDESTVCVTISDQPIEPPQIKNDTWKSNWPLERHEVIDISNLAKLSIDAKTNSNGANSYDALDLNNDDTTGVSAVVEETDGWDLDNELEEDVEVEDGTEPVAPTNLAAYTWVHKSTVPADHIAAGSFETAAQLLNRQVGAVKFEPLKQRFFDVYSACKLAMTGHEGLPPLSYNITRGPANELPFVPGFDHLQARLQEAFGQVKVNQLELAVDSFRSILHTVVTLAVETESEESEVRDVIDTCKNYIIAFSIEIQRRLLPKDDLKRNLELAAYFTKPKLRPAHAGLPLRTACLQANNAKNYSLASHFAAEYLKIDSSGPAAKKMAASKAKWDAAKSLDAVDIDFDMYGSFDIDPKSLTPIYEGQPFVVDPLTKAKYHASNKGQLCAITLFTEVGAAASGLRVRV